MEQICERWKNHCDLIFLFANDSVLEYYPKFGFTKKQEYEYSMIVLGKQKVTMDKLHMKIEENIELVKAHYKILSNYSALSMLDNEILHEFYYQGVFAEHVWYDQEANLIFCMEQEDNAVVVYDILGKSNLTLEEVSQRIAWNFNIVTELQFRFTPVNTQELAVNLHKEEDTTLFVRGNMEKIFDSNNLMFPENIHA
ncbi:hypothetical protein IAI10_01440 [Clostridium sp. 19966]|uniref:hypothetical protein n=1 Tax=Clostridium sp. 19966 TaxID=2768166 RepID=UPI0028DE6694|nr:hypothetical protein [Clostridium sp. 19966]MDT8715339.1 hypothetical protein [Clostridium sp. 19966]